VMYTFFVGLLAMPVVQIASIGTQVSEAFAGLDRVREVLDLATEDQEDEARAPLAEVRGRVEFRDVWFEYEPDTPVLKGVSFEVPEGQTVALVGSSGSGKSTILGLVMAFNSPQRGSVLLDGRDVHTLRLRDYRRALGVVMQDNFLFDGTIAENVGFAKPGASREEIEAVAKIAHVDEFASRFEQRLDTVVGERGVKLSGGQRQRVAIARVMLKDAPILLLDEATSALDSEVESAIQASLYRLMEGKTVVAIAHRLSTIAAMDRLVVMDHGRIVEMGDHKSLLAAGGIYARLWAHQSGGFLGEEAEDGAVEGEGDSAAMPLPSGVAAS